MTRWPVLAAMLVAAASHLQAHDMWIEPTAFTPAVGSIVGVKLRVGERFVGSPIPRDPKLIEEFVSVGRGGRTAIVGRNGSDPAGLIRIDTPGLIVAGYRSRPTPVTLEAEAFTRYLKEEGLERIIDARAARGEGGRPGREIFTRYAKSLLFAGANGEGADRALGFPLELLAERNPDGLPAGASLPVRLVHEGRPLEGALVVAMNRSNPSGALTARSDNAGRVAFRLPHDGVWLVKAVHMVPALKGSGADWWSLWASLTFEVRRG